MFDKKHQKYMSSNHSIVYCMRSNSVEILRQNIEEHKI